MHKDNSESIYIKNTYMAVVDDSFASVLSGQGSPVVVADVRQQVESTRGFRTLQVRNGHEQTVD